MHTSEGRRTSRYAVKLYGANNPTTRAQVEKLDPQFVGGSFAQRSEIAGRTKDPEVLRLALADTDAVVLGALKNPRIDPKILDAATTTTAKTLIVIDNPRTRNTTLRRLVSEGKGTVQRAALDRLMTRGEDISGYVTSGSQQVREEMASKTKDPRIRAALLDDSSPFVRERAVRNRHVALGLPLTIADDPSARVLLAAAKVTNSRPLLERLAHTNDILVQKAIMENPRLTDEVLHTLALSGSTVAREKVPRRSVHAVGKDAEASEFEIREAYKHADDLDEITTAHPGNAEAIRLLATDATRRALGRHLHAPDYLKYAELKNQPAPHLIALAEENSTSPFILTELSRRRFTKLRVALILNPTTPIDVVRRFADLGTKEVSKTARDELKRRA